jgi:hypothetical protein
MRHSENGMSAVPSMAVAHEPMLDNGSLVPIIAVSICSKTCAAPAPQLPGSSWRR